MKFAAVIAYDPQDSRLAEVRPPHRKYLAELLEKNLLVISGPFTEGGGALIVYETATKEEAETLLRADPFTTSGVFTSWTIRPWNPIFFNNGLLKAPPA